MDNVSGFDLILKYDTPALAKPTVSQGSLISGAMFAANANTAGTIRIAVVSSKSFSGSGPLVTITFETNTGQCYNNYFNPIDSNGATVKPALPPVAVAAAAVAVVGRWRRRWRWWRWWRRWGGKTGGNTGVVAPGATSSSGSTYLGTVTMPSDSQPQNEAKPAPATETATKPGRGACRSRSARPGGNVCFGESRGRPEKGRSTHRFHYLCPGAIPGSIRV